MMLAAGGLATVGASMWGASELENLMNAYIPTVASTSRNMMTDQILTRKYYEYDMRIQRQMLHREDIRDLMDLTVGRMDIFHVVGTLILSFCLTWFTDAKIQEADVPQWFKTLFFVSNFSAVGYLVLSVWLAMHASIAAHSVCVRLLTSFARLTIPSNDELKKMTMPILPKLEEFVSFARQQLGVLKAKMAKSKGAPSSSSPAKAKTAAKSTPEKEPVCDRAQSVAAANVAAGVTFPPAMSRDRTSRHQLAGSKDHDTGEGDTDHFERYLEEQKRWLGYDAYARVCMSLGMNQMLQALAYYVVAGMCKTMPHMGFTAFFGVKFLAYLLLKLDISDMASAWKEYLHIVAFMVLPTLSASVGFIVLEKIEGQGYLALFVTPCFLLHGLWIIFLALDLELNPMRSRDTLPRRFRTVAYLDVSDGRQQRLADKFLEEKALGQVETLAAAREGLEALVERSDQMEELEAAGKQAEKWEDASGKKAMRGGEELQRARQRLMQALEDARAGGTASRGRRGRREMELAAQALDRLDLWQQAPQVQAALAALQDEKVRGYLSEDQKQIIEQHYQEFLSHCRALDVSVPDSSSPAPAKARQQHVRFSARGLVDEWHGLPDSVWVNASDGAVTWQRPDDESTSFASALKQEVAWVEKAEGLTASASCRPSHPLGRVPQASRGQAVEVELPRLSSSEERPRSSPQREERREKVPLVAAPDHMLPKRIVKDFTLATSLWWTAAAFIHVVQTLHELAHKPMFLQTQVVHRLPAWRPGRAAFFEVGSINCNSTHVLLSDRFSHYAAERSAGTGALGSLYDLGEAGVAAELSWLRGAGVGLSSASSRPPVQMPASWRLAATAWEPCAASANASCGEAFLAGWDGEAVGLASASLDPVAGSWRSRTLFRVHPGMGRRSSAGGTSAVTEAAAGAYNDVRALHLSSGGNMLAVLLGSRELDLWDLAAGLRLGRWRLGKNYSALCRDGADLLLARQDDDGPVFELARLPEVSKPKQGRGHFLEAAPRKDLVVEA